MTGIVHHQEKDKPPIVNLNGNLVSVPMTKFDIYDTRDNFESYLGGLRFTISRNYHKNNLTY